MSATSVMGTKARWAIVDRAKLRRAWWRIALCFCAASPGAACKTMVAPTSDYAAYRSVRVAPTVPGQLRAASAYLDRYPAGAFHDEVSGWFARVEPLFYEASADSAQGMQDYLSALPRGPHAAAAEQRRDALLAAQRSEAGEGIARAGAIFEQRLARAAQSRENVLSAYASWIARLLELDGWGRPLESAGEPFASAWAADPKPTCTPSVCSKTTVLSYELELAGKPQAFVCTIDVTLRLDKGRVVEATVGGPDLFARLIEAHEARPAAADARSRIDATAWLVEFTGGAAERKLARGRCAASATAPALMTRRCDGWKLDLVPRQGDGIDDRVVIRGPAKL